MARWLIEADCQAIKTQIQNNIASALSAISTARGDNLVTTDPPREYFFYPNSWGMNAPYVYIVGMDMDFRQSEKEANHINALSRILVSVVIEDQTGENLVIKSWRYQVALHQCLDQMDLTTSDNAAKLKVVVKRAEMGAMFSTAKNELDTQSAFRREVYLECSVEHYENN